jgi:hypothetical protein
MPLSIAHLYTCTNLELKTRIVKAAVEAVNYDNLCDFTLGDPDIAGNPLSENSANALENVPSLGTSRRLSH